MSVDFQISADPNTQSEASSQPRSWILSKYCSIDLYTLKNFIKPMIPPLPSREPADSAGVLSSSFYLGEAIIKQPWIADLKAL